MPELVCKKQVAEMLGLATRTVDAWEQRGWLPRSIRLGDGSNNLTGLRGVKRWRLAEIEAFLQSKRKDS